MCVRNTTIKTTNWFIRMAIAEVFTLGVKAGVEPLELWLAIRQGAIGRARTFDRIGDQYLQDKYEPAAFALRLAHKDLALGLELGRQLGVPMKYGELAFQDLTAALERGWGERDSRSPMQLQNERAGVTIKVSAEDVKRTLARE
jgi:3-hydroxyisobutyrate dehydrogenase